jgi:hypothetical protein
MQHMKKCEWKVPVHLAPVVGGRQYLGQSRHQVVNVVNLIFLTQNDNLLQK